MKNPWYLILLFIMLVTPVYGQTPLPDVISENRFLAGPYILDVTTDSAVVAFHLRDPIPAKVRIIDKELETEFMSEEADRSHFIKVTGLKPGSTYRYEVICGAGEIRTPESDPGFQIKTACLPGESFSFAVFGDPRPGETETNRHHRDIIEQIIFNEPAFSLILGDMVDDGADFGQWQAFFNVEAELLKRTAAYPVKGDNDHAYGNGIGPQFFPKLEKGYYSFEWGGIYFFAMDAWDVRGNQDKKELDADSPQIKWLEAELSREEVQNAPFRVVFLHDPVFISRGRASDTLRYVWAPVFQKYNVDVVFASWHLYERSHHQGITYIITGGAGAELIWEKPNPSYASQADAREYHFCRVDINSNAMTIRAIAANGTILDNITLTPTQHRMDIQEQLSRTAKSLGNEIILGENLPEIPVYLFTTPGCDDCRELLNSVFPWFSEFYQVGFKIILFNLDQPGTYELFLNAGIEFGRQDADLPAVFIGNSVLGGINEINESLSLEIEDYLNDPQIYKQQSIIPFTVKHDSNEIKLNILESLNLKAVMAAGIQDGIRPCALTAIACLTAYLFSISLAGRRKEIICFGGLFTLIVFTTAFAFELDFLGMSNVASKNIVFLRVINAILLIVAIGFTAFAVKNLIIHANRNADYKGFRIPGIGNRLKSGPKNTGIILTIISVLLGIIVASALMSCTGREYSSISLMISEPSHRFEALPYLLLYHIAFVMPLIAACIFSTFWTLSETVGKITRKHTAIINFGSFILFLLMAAIAICNL